MEGEGKGRRIGRVGVRHGEGGSPTELFPPAFVQGSKITPSRYPEVTVALAYCDCRRPCEVRAGRPLFLVKDWNRKLSTLGLDTSKYQ